ncbi:MAG TPA: glycosyltransferase family 2 protein [Candidatus Coprousia avicola]|nr:glycosyltransferase family 2 protein [Candidatus Coprousia avicola]
MCKISIVVPVYNGAEHLESCLKSLTSQTMDDIEVIIVDDGSTDGSLRVADKFSLVHPFVKVYSTENKGPGHARNYGATQSRGDYLAFVDSDDRIEPDYCKAMYDKAITDENDLVLCLHDEIAVVEEDLASIIVSSPLFDLGNFTMADHRTLLAEVNIAPWGKLIERNLFFKAQFPNDLRYAEDQVFSAKVFCLARSIGSVKCVLYHYYRETYNGITSSFGSERLDWVKAMERLCMLVRSDDSFSRYRVELEFFIIAKSIRLCSAAVARVDAPTNLRVGLVKGIFATLKENISGWRDNPYYINDVRKRAHSSPSSREDYAARRYPNLVYCNYCEWHILILIVFSRVFPRVIFHAVLAIDQLLFSLFRKLRWEIIPHQIRKIN